jgi:hypothetical protein
MNLGKRDKTTGQTSELIDCDQTKSSNPIAVFEELIGQLEEYGPIWYTEELHARALAALQLISSAD